MKSKQNHFTLEQKWEIFASFIAGTHCTVALNIIYTEAHYFIHKMCCKFQGDCNYNSTEQPLMGDLYDYNKI